MKCFNHEDREAVATCQHCGKALCKACASKYTPCLCDECFQAIQQEAHAQRVAAAEGHRQSRLERLSFSSGDLILNCVLGAILTILAAVANADNEYYSLLELAPLAPLFFCFPAGGLSAGGSGQGRNKWGSSTPMTSPSGHSSVASCSSSRPAGSWASPPSCSRSTRCSGPGRR